MTVAPDIVAAAQAAQKKWGVPSSVAIAQYGLESGWGGYMPANSNNPFGIQELPGLPSVAANSHEFRNGQLVPVVEHFAVFKDIADAFDQHAKLLATYRAYRYAMAQVSSSDRYLNDGLAFYGNVQDNVASATTEQSNDDTQLRTQLSTLQDADETQSIIDLNEAQTQQQAALQSEAQIPRTSLFNFLS